VFNVLLVNSHQCARVRGSSEPDHKDKHTPSNGVARMAIQAKEPPCASLSPGPNDKGARGELRCATELRASGHHPATRGSDSSGGLTTPGNGNVLTSACRCSTSS
jgi:hypothetical protein